MATLNLTPSSARTGFFQTTPTVLPAYTSSSITFTSPSDDPTIPRLLALYLSPPTPTHITTHLHTFSRQVLHPTLLNHTNLAALHPPTTHPYTTLGHPSTSPTQLRTSPSWQYLQAFQTTHGLISHAYPTGPPPTTNHRIYQFLLSHIFDPSSAVVTCPAAMTDGAAALLRSQLSSPDLTQQDPRRKVFQDAYNRLTSNNPDTAWSAGQWMTERSGGSDVRGTESVAVPISDQQQGGVDTNDLPLGDWEISGHKWFSSATDSACAVMLARTAKGGMSCFFAPVKRKDQNDGGEVVMNGVSVVRLKEKLGTCAVPTAELELKGMRAWLVGKEGEGVKAISRVLNITRLHTAKMGVANWGRGLAVARAWTRVRMVGGGKDGGKVPLGENRQHVRWMAQEVVRYRAYVGLYMLGVALLGVGEEEGVRKGTNAEEMGLFPKTRQGVEALLRVLTPVAKASCSMAAVVGLRECMESLGGVGYCENNGEGGLFNLARLYRDANVNPIWEGTVSVLSEDTLRALKVGAGKGMQTLEGTVGEWLRNVLGGSQIKTIFAKEVEVLWKLYEKLRNSIESKTEEELLWSGREVVKLLSDIFCAVILLTDAAVDNDEVATAVAKRWVAMVVDDRDVADWQVEAEMDRRIFLGEATVDRSSKL